jgi:DNA-binding response OmpR family regulator
MEPKKRILLIEDDANTQALYSEILENANYDVTIAHDGQEGLEVARRGGFTLILLDIMLPKLDGLGVLGGLQTKAPTAPNGPIIVLTNLSNDVLSSQAMSLGAKGYLIKSDIHTNDLVSKLQTFLAQS